MDVEEELDKNEAEVEAAARTFAAGGAPPEEEEGFEYEDEAPERSAPRQGAQQPAAAPQPAASIDWLHHPWDPDEFQNACAASASKRPRRAASSDEGSSYCEGLGPTNASRKRKTRAQLQQTSTWMSTFTRAAMDYLVKQPAASTLSDRKLKELIRDQLEQMPSEGQPQPSVDDVVRAFNESNDGLPSCLDACQTIFEMVGHLALDSSSKAFSDAAAMRVEAERDLERLEAAWRVVGSGMDVKFTNARTAFHNAVFNRTAGELPAPLRLLSATMPQSTAPPSNHAIISLPSFITPVCAGLHNVGIDSASPISTSFDIFRCCAGLDKHPIDENPFWFKLESGADSEFNDGSAMLIRSKITDMMKATCVTSDFPDVQSFIEHIDKHRSSDDATLQFEVYAHWPAMRLKNTLDAAAEMLEVEEAMCASGRDRGGRYSIDGTLHFRGRDYERDMDTNRVLLSSVLLVRVDKPGGQDHNVTGLVFRYSDKKPVLEVELSGKTDVPGRKISFDMSRPRDADAFGKLLRFDEYLRSDLEAARRRHGSTACANGMLMYYAAALISANPPSLPEYGKRLLDPMPGDDAEQESMEEAFNHRADPEVLASMAASIMGDKVKACYMPSALTNTSKPTLQWFAWDPKDLWAQTVEPEVRKIAFKALGDVGSLVEKKVSDSVSFSEMEYHFNSTLRRSIQPWKPNAFDASALGRREDVVRHVRKHSDNQMKRLQASRDPFPRR
jgi:hypothetical protein